MEEFDDEFSDLYADVVVQASSAISAMHRLTGMKPKDDRIFDSANRGEEVKDRFNGAVVGGNHKIYDRGAKCEDVERDVEAEGGGGGLINLPMENGDISGSESEDDLDIDGDNIYKQKFVGNYDSDKYDNRIRDSGCRVRVTNMIKHEGGHEIEEDEKRRGGINGDEKCVKGGDYNSQGKSLEYDSLSSKKRRVDEMAHNVHKSCKKEDADAGNRELCFRREGEIEASQPNLGRKYGGPNNASESCRPLDLDKCGSVQVSDSVEDNHHEVSDSDSDGMTGATETSYDTNRRKTSSISNKVSSSAESESSESSWSRHNQGPSCSRSPSVAQSDKYTENIHKLSKYPSSSLTRESQEAMTCKRYQSRDFRCHGVKESTSGDRYYEEQSGNSRNHSNQHKKYDDMRYLKTRLTDEDASYAIDVKRHYNRHVGHGKQRGMRSFNSYEIDVPYCSRTKSYSTYSDGFFPDYRLGRADLKNQNWNIHPSSRYKAGYPDAHNISGRQRFLEKSQMDYEAPESGWYHNQRSHPVRRNIEGSRNFTQKYSIAGNQRGTRFVSRGDGAHFRMRTHGDYSSLPDEYDNKFVEGGCRRICSSGGRNRDHRCDRNVRNERETESSRRGKRRHGSPLNNSENLWYTESEINERRNIKHWPSPFYSSEEPCAYGPEPGVPDRKLRPSWKEMRIKNGWYNTDIAFSDTGDSLRYHHSEDHRVRRRHYQQSSSIYFMNGRSNHEHDKDNFVRRRHHQYADVLRSIEDKSRQQDDTMFHSEEPSYHFEKNLRNNMADDRHAFDRAGGLTDEREVNGDRSKMMREQDSSNQFDWYRKSIEPHSPVQMYPRYQDSIEHLVVVGRKGTLQPSVEAGHDEYYCMHDLMELDDNQKSKIFEASGNFHPKKAILTSEGKVNSTLCDKNQPSKFSENQQDEFLDIEEGQIITEDIRDLMKQVSPSKVVLSINDKRRTETASDGNREDQRLDDEKIREIMLKMERRRERFKEASTMGRDSVKISNPLPDLDAESAEAKLKRPARKRRWT